MNTGITLTELDNMDELRKIEFCMWINEVHKNMYKKSKDKNKEVLRGSNL